MTKYLFLLFFVVIFCGCKKDRLKDEKEVFIGKWQWVYSEADLFLCDGFPSYDDTLTPQSESANYSLEFEKKGKVQLYKDDQLMASYRVVFKVFGGPYYSCYVNYTGFEIALDNYEGSDVNYLIGGCVNADSLIIKNGFPFYDDGCNFYTNYFVKE